MRPVVTLAMLCVLACGDTGRATESRAQPGPQAVLKPDEALAEPQAPTPPATGLPQCGDPESCYRRGIDELRAGRHPVAAKLFARGCDEHGHASSCNRFGMVLRDGVGIEPDDNRARRVFEQGCALGSKLACDNMGH